MRLRDRAVRDDEGIKRRRGCRVGHWRCRLPCSRPQPAMLHCSFPNHLAVAVRSLCWPAHLVCCFGLRSKDSSVSRAGQSMLAQLHRNVSGIPRAPGRENEMRLLKEQNARSFDALWDDHVTLRGGAPSRPPSQNRMFCRVLPRGSSDG